MNLIEASERPLMTKSRPAKVKSPFQRMANLIPVFILILIIYPSSLREDG
jgi:hypothetical protein